MTRNAKVNYVQKVVIWSAVFLFHYLVTHFVLKPLGITYYSSSAWIAGVFSLSYISGVALVMYRQKGVMLSKEFLFTFLALVVGCAAISVALIYLYRFLDFILPPVVMQNTDTPFLWYSYIFPRTAGIIYQQLMFYYLVLFTANQFKEVEKQSRIVGSIFFIDHLLIYLIVPNFFIATSMLVGSFFLGYMLPKLYRYYSDRGLYIGYLVHYGYYILFAPLSYFVFRWLQ